MPTESQTLITRYRLRVCPVVDKDEVVVVLYRYVFDLIVDGAHLVSQEYLSNHGWLEFDAGAVLGDLVSIPGNELVADDALDVLCAKVEIMVSAGINTP